MKTPHFLRLAMVDEQRFVTACRHGLVHLTWGRTTTRLTRDEFRQLARLLERAADGIPPHSVCDGELSVTSQLDDDYELRIGLSVLFMSPSEFRKLVKAVLEAVRCLDEILASGVWDREEAEDTPTSFFEQLRRIPFSRN